MPPFIKNVALGAGGLVVAVSVYTAAVIGANYNGAILTHLEDIINGTNTSVVVATNAPNFGLGIPMLTPSVSTIATSSNPNAASGLASSTPYTFAISALDGTGTTTLSTTVTQTTDASNTQAKPENINIKWSSVNGATGYAIWFATSSKATAFTQYFLATTTSQFTFSTSTGSLPGSYTKSTTTAFSELLNPNGAEVFNDSVNTSTSTTAASTTVLQVNGTADMTTGATTTACEPDTAGAIFYNQANKHEWGCDGTAWNKIF